MTRISTRCGSNASGRGTSSPRCARVTESISATSTTDIGISLNETVTTADVQDIVNVFAEALGKPTQISIWPAADPEAGIPNPRRKSEFMTHPCSIHIVLKPQMMRYIRSPRAERHRPRYLDDSAWFLHDEAECCDGNAAGDLGALLPRSSVRAGRTGARLCADHRGPGQALAEITGFAAVSLQPNSGARANSRG